MIKRVMQVIREIIGQTRVVRRMINQAVGGVYPLRDIGTADYAFFDRLRRGQAAGLEVSGLLVKPIVSKISGWTLGRPVRFRSETADTGPLDAWWGENLAEIVRAYEDSMGLGDSYIVVNGDLSLTVVPPHVVTPIVDEDDYSQVVGYRIAERWPHPSRPGATMTIIDEYTAGARVRVIERDGVPVDRQEFQTPFLDGRVPVIPIRNNVGSNEVNGTPELAAAVGLLHRYGQTMDTTLDGQKRSTPVISFSDVGALDRFWQQYARQERRQMADGTVETYETIPFSSDEVMAIVGDMKYANPAAIAGDAEKMLILLYLLLIEHAEIPEFVMGSAIASSKASAEEQMSIFVRYVEKRRALARAWVLDVMSVVQRFMVARGEIGGVDDGVNILWEGLTSQDGKLTLEVIRWAVTEGFMDGKTALELAPVDIDDVDAVIEAAMGERSRQAATRAAADYGGDIEVALSRIDPAGREAARGAA